MEDKNLSEPKDLDAERGVLSCACLNDDSMNRFLQAGLCAEAFYAPNHKLIFEAMLLVHRSSVKLDLITLIDRMRDDATLNLAGDVRGVNEVLSAVDSVGSASHWCDIVMKKYMLRVLRRAAENIILQVNEKPADVGQLVQVKVRELMELGTQNKSLSQVAIVDKAKTMFESELSGDWMHGNCVRTGLIDFDVPMGMLRTSLEDYLVILFAPPSCGKSTLARQIARVNCDDGKRVLVFLRETSAVRFYVQMAANWAEFNLRHASNPPAPDAGHGQDIKLWQEARDQARVNLDLIENEWAEKRLWVYDEDKTISEIEARARMIARECGDLNLIVVDYVQIVQPDDPRLPREQQIANISMRLKDLGKELDCTVLALCQQNRESRKGIPRIHNPLDKDGNKKRDNSGNIIKEEYMQFPQPQLTDLRESGALEQDADCVIGVFQPSFDYNNDLQKKSWEKLLIQLHVLKRRNGPVGHRNFILHKNITTFKDLPNVKEDGTYMKREEYRDE